MVDLERKLVSEGKEGRGDALEVEDPGVRVFVLADFGPNAPIPSPLLRFRAWGREGGHTGCLIQSRTLIFFILVFSREVAPL
jgi:hypothetical protein